MAVKQRLEARLYRNTGSEDDAVWKEIKSARNVTLNLENGEADEYARPWRYGVAMLNLSSMEFEMALNEADDDFTAIHEAFLSKGSIDFAVLDVASGVGSQGLRSTMAITDFTLFKPRVDRKRLKHPEVREVVIHEKVFKFSVTAKSTGWKQSESDSA